MPRFRVSTKTKLLTVSFFTFLVLSFCFQNCEQTLVSTVLSESSPAANQSTTDGNGTGYDGKPGTFYNYVPDFSCEGKESFFAQVSTENQQINYIKNSSLKCGIELQTIAESDLERSPFHGELIGYREKIFQFSEVPFLAIPNVLTEAWCFNQSGEKDFEIVQRYGRSDQASTTQIYFKKNGVNHQVAPSRTTRIVDSATAIFRGSSYELQIFRQKMVASGGTYAGKVSAIVDGVPIKKDLSCRLGGYLDTQLWPARVVIDGNVRKADFDQSTTKVYASVGVSSNFKIVEGSLDNNQPSRVIPNLIVSGYGADVVKMSPDHKYLVYRDNNRLLYSHDLQTHQTISLRNPLHSIVSQSVDREYKIVGDMVYYKEYVQVSGSQVHNQFRRVSLKGDRALVIHDGGVANADTPDLLNGYDVSFGMSSVLFGLKEAQNLPLQLFSMPNSADVSKNLTPQFSDGSYLLSMGQHKLVGLKQEYVLFPIVTPQANPNIGYYNLLALAVDGSSQALLGIAGVPTSSVIVPQGDMIYLTAMIPKPGSGFLVSTQASYLVEFGSWHTRSVPTLTSVVADANSNAFYGLSNEQIFRIDISTAVSQQICSEIKGAQKIIAGKKAGVYILAGSASATKIYRYQDSGSCPKIAEVPLPSHLGPAFVLSPDERHALVVTGFDNTGVFLPVVNTKNQMFWIPLNGQAPLKISTPEMEGSYSFDARYSIDSKSIIFLSRPFGGSVSQLFQWKIPKDF